MTAHTDLGNLRTTLDALAAHGVVPGVGAALQTRHGQLTRELIDAVTGEVEAYRESGNPDVIPELEAHLTEVVGKAFTFVGFPLKVVGAHGGPTRAVAVVD